MLVRCLVERMYLSFCKYIDINGHIWKFSTQDNGIKYVMIAMVAILNCSKYTFYIINEVSMLDIVKYHVLYNIIG